MFHLHNEKKQEIWIHEAIADRIGRIKLIEFETVKESC
jgi:hypothetical protein